MPAAASATRLPDLARLIKLGARPAKSPPHRGRDALDNAALMPSATNGPASASAIAFAHEVARLWERELADDFLGFYLIGSLAHGGFNERYSDIDVLLTAAKPLGPQVRDNVAQQATALSLALAGKLSLHWTVENFSAGRFLPLDRLDYLDHAVMLLERRRVEPLRPSRAEVRAYLAGAPFENWTQQVAHFSALETLTRGDHKRYLRAILYPARFVYSWETGAMASNDEAVLFLRRRADNLDFDLIARALECRNRGADPSPLFPERDKLPGLLDACRRLVAASGG